MRRLLAWMNRVAGMFRTDRRERELADEIESHLQLHTDDHLRRGLSPDEARRAARAGPWRRRISQAAVSRAAGAALAGASGPRRALRRAHAASHGGADLGRADDALHRHRRAHVHVQHDQGLDSRTAALCGPRHPRGPSAPRHGFGQLRVDQSGRLPGLETIGTRLRGSCRLSQQRQPAHRRRSRGARQRRAGHDQLLRDDWRAGCHRPVVRRRRRGGRCVTGGGAEPRHVARALRRRPLDRRPPGRTRRSRAHGHRRAAREVSVHAAGARQRLDAAGVHAGGRGRPSPAIGHRPRTSA